MHKITGLLVGKLGYNVTVMFFAGLSLAVCGGQRGPCHWPLRAGINRF